MTRFLLLLSALGLASAQTGDGLRARRMYYQQGADQQTAVVTPTTPTTPSVGKKTTPAKQQVRIDPQPNTSPGPGPLDPGPGPTPVVSAALRIGLRYTILDVDPANKRRPEEVDPDSAMRNGQCFAVLLQPNRGGYLYVFNAGTSGSWTLLPPSSGAQPGPIQASAYRPARVPQKDCYAIDPPSGNDKLFVVMTERAEDVKKLSESIRSDYGNRKHQANPNTPVLTASRAYTSQIDAFRGELQSRDIRIQKVSNPESSQDPPNSVFVVANDSRSNDRIVIEIVIKHN
jgi:hypothetical protein